ncbi:MAG: toprim domain-containing protein, partial [Pseudohongiellaceae bacterium]
MKTKSFGAKVGYPWFLDMQRLQSARTIYVVESAINALSIDACDMPFTAAVAVRAIRALDGIDWSFFHGKQLILCFDNDEPDKKNRCAGQEASWQLYDILAAQNISALIVDQSQWEHNDINDILQSGGTEEVKIALKRLQPWALQGLPGEISQHKGRSRLFLPSHDVGMYWRYRVKPDFTTYVSKFDQDPDGGTDKMSFEDISGFRVAAISRVTIASANSVLSGSKDAMPQTLFSVTVQSPRHGATLQRRVFEDEELHNKDKWGKFGPVFKPAAFSRLVNILERSSHLGSREAINFVGLGWLNGKLVVNEGHNAFFTDPKQQCPYSDLIFPTGTKYDAATVVEAYSRTFTHSAALIPLVWALGAHLKALMGFWPHMVMQAAKASGKSTLCKKLEDTVGMTIFSRQSIESPFRVLTSICHTSHPVGWEEISAGRQEIIDSAVSSLQQAYQYSLTRRGAKMMEFLICAPVLL